jgi:hypothetical protein
MNTKYIKVGNHYEIALTTDRSGRTSIVVHEKPHWNNRTIIDVELPAKTGEYANSFKPTVKVKAEIETEVMPE